MNEMEPSDGARSAVPSDASASATETPISRRSMLTVGVPAVIAVVAAGAVPFVIGAGNERIRTSGIDAPATDPPATTTPPDNVFTSTGVTVEEAPILPGSTTSTTTTTTATTTTTPTTTTSAPTTLPAEPPQPIPPPPDPRGYEDQILLGGHRDPQAGR